MGHSKTMFVTLRDGSAALLRPIEPTDEQRLHEGFRLLSPRSRYLRFHTGLTQLTDGQLRYLTEVDGWDHVAWVYVDHAEARGGRQALERASLPLISLTGSQGRVV